MCIIKVSEVVSANMIVLRNYSHRFNCSKVTCVNISGKQALVIIVLTISSLHIGQASLELAEVAVLAADGSPCSRDVLAIRSWLSDEGGVKRPESRERLLGEGERRWALDLRG